MPLRISRRQFALGSLAAGAALAAAPPAASAAPAATTKSKPVIPGTGIRVARTGDDFENEDWVWYPQHPKSSWNIDENIRVPGGITKNQQWAEGAKRGQPDVVKRVETPPNGPVDSKGAMLIQSLYSGIPGTLTGAQQQDDLLHNAQALNGGRTIPVSWSPNCICRIYIVPHSKWEQRDGASFGYRIGLLGWGRESNNEEYWPGIFVHMERGLKDNKRTYQMRAWIRADGYGRDLPSLTFEPDTWCTMGMSCTPDGAVHFFARKDLEDLTIDDCVGSYWCYSYRAHSFQTFFYNVINQDNGRSVSTPWIIDDAMLYAATAPSSSVKNGTPPQRTAQASEPKQPTPPADATEAR